MEHVEKASGIQGEQAQHQLSPDTILNGKYLIKRVIGEGGFGITYEGVDLNLELKVAIKEYYPSGFVTRGNSAVIAYAGSSEEYYEKGKKSFLNEAKTLARFQFLPGIVGVRDFFLENNTAYIVMEFLDGMTLKEYVNQSGGRLPAKQILDFMRPVIGSLAQVHGEGLIHRDISPENIIITKKGQVKLLDFGAAREISPSGEKSLSVLLKPGYAPEEQYRTHGEQGPWTDVYGLCATIYRCMTGNAPEEPLERVRWDRLKAPSACGAQTTEKQDAVLMKGLALYAENRYQTVSELEMALYGGEEEKVFEEKRQPCQKQAQEAPPGERYNQTNQRKSPPSQGSFPGRQGNEERQQGTLPGKSPYESSGGKKKWIIGLLLVICILSGAAVWLLFPKEEVVLGNSNGNISNFGAIASMDSRLVYSNVDGSCILIEKENSGWKTVKTRHLGYLNLWESWIYYLNPEGIIERVPQSNPGQEAEQVGKGNVSAFLIVDGIIYYNGLDGTIHSMTAEGKRDRELAGGVNSGINYEDGQLYFLRSGSTSGEKWKVCRMNTDGSGIKTVGSSPVEEYIVQDGWIYYINPDDDDSIYRMKTDGKQESSLGTGAAGGLNICGEWIYFAGTEGHPGLYRVKKGGSDEKQMDSRTPDFLYVIDQTLYYAVYEQDVGGYNLYSMNSRGSSSLVYEEKEKNPPDDVPKDVSEDVPDDVFLYQGEEVQSLELILKQIDDGNMQEISLSPVNQFETGEKGTLEPLDYMVSAYELAAAANGDGSKDLTVYMSLHSSTDLNITNDDFLVIAMNEDDMKFCVAKSCEDLEFPVSVKKDSSYSVKMKYQVPDGYQYLFVYTNILNNTVNGPMYMTGLE
ncbi:MAG: DUF5050 domain-containing protein [Lachnospiraceae bacterium]|nr:DUF5050 domain-containing protein [Lachnospiraceae bacterium]